MRSRHARRSVLDVKLATGFQDARGEPTMDASRFLAKPLEKARRILDLSHRLRVRLPLLGGEQPGKLVLPRQQQRGSTFQDIPPLHRGGFPPGALSLHRAFDGPLHRGGVRGA